LFSVTTRARKQKQFTVLTIARLLNHRSIPETNNAIYVKEKKKKKIAGGEE